MRPPFIIASAIVPCITSSMLSSSPENPRRLMVPATFTSFSQPFSSDIGPSFKSPFSSTITRLSRTAVLLCWTGNKTIDSADTDLTLTSILLPLMLPLTKRAFDISLSPISIFLVNCTSSLILSPFSDSTTASFETTFPSPLTLRSAPALECVANSVKVSEFIFTEPSLKFVAVTLSRKELLIEISFIFSFFSVVLTSISKLRSV
mmetsp:Transcript_37743/g.55312  ORF Transcript_37743/g.55312 Transcript_37743/m.55312 type:complete len:205 (-) Transcript_37743:2906-3520(-)